MSARIFASPSGLLPSRLNNRTASAIGTAKGFKIGPSVGDWDILENLKNVSELRWMFLGKDGSHGPVECFFTERTKP
jgi:hypothetical protein